MDFSRQQHELAVASVIRKLHEEKNISRDDLAKFLQFPELEITRLENGSEPLSVGALFGLLEYYGLSWPEFEAMVNDALPEAKSWMDKISHTRSE